MGLLVRRPAGGLKTGGGARQAVMSERQSWELLGQMLLGFADALEQTGPAQPGADQPEVNPGMTLAASETACGSVRDLAAQVMFRGAFGSVCGTRDWRGVPSRHKLTV